VTGVGILPIRRKLVKENIFSRRGESKSSALGYEREIQPAWPVQGRFTNRPCKIMPDRVSGSDFLLIAEG